MEINDIEIPQEIHVRVWKDGYMELIPENAWDGRNNDKELKFVNVIYIAQTIYKTN